MIDMLVRLYDLPKSQEIYHEVENLGVIIRRPGAYEKHIVSSFIQEHFSAKWVSEFEIACHRQPISSFIATRNSEVLGFACYETSSRGFFGPTGVLQTARGMGIGKALLLKSLEAMYAEGHAYAFIGGVGPKEFYEKAVGAIEIPGSNPGIYVDILPEKQSS
jgi:GNAT superfamily N-acetyltransferase